MTNEARLRRLRSGAGGAAASALVAAWVATGCSTQAPLLSADPSGAALFQQGQDALVNEDWRDAVTALDSLLKNYPSSPFLAEARLGLGRAYYEQKRVEMLILAIDAFQSFLTYHPAHQHVDYAQYMVGMTYMAQMRSPDRDQTATHDAIGAFDRFLENYPDSHLRDAVIEERRAAIDNLASHELRVARWQARFDEHWLAAAERAEAALEQYPETTLKCELTFVAAEAYRKGERFEDAARHYREVVNGFPGCPRAAEAEDRLRDLG